MKTIAVPDCQVGEDVVFSQDNRWFLTCMGSQAMIVGDAQADKPIQTVKLSKPYPHGIAIHDGIDRILVTSTVRASDLGDAGETITAIEASTGKVLEATRSRRRPRRRAKRRSRSCSCPAKPVAYVTNMYGASLWTAAGMRRRRPSTSPWRTTFPPRRPGYRSRCTSPRSPT